MALVIIVLLIASFFIPAERVSSVSVQNTFANAVAALRQPTSWRSLDSGKNTQVSEVSFMLYQITEPRGNGDSTRFSLAVIPDMSPRRNPNNIGFSYGQPTSLFFKLFPSLEKPSIESHIVGELRNYLEDNTRFYGYPITTQSLVDSFFLAQQKNITTCDLFSTLPGMISGLTTYAAGYSCKIIAQNISIVPLGRDSITLMAGLNIDRPIPGDDLHTFRQLPTTLGLVVGQYSGPFRDRTGIYRAMEKFITDHELAKHGLPYEHYQGPLPTADSSMVKFELLYPVSYR